MVSCTVCVCPGHTGQARRKFRGKCARYSASGQVQERSGLSVWLGVSQSRRLGVGTSLTVSSSCSPNFTPIWVAVVLLILAAVGLTVYIPPSWHKTDASSNRRTNKEQIKIIQVPSLPNLLHSVAKRCCGMKHCVCLERSKGLRVSEAA